MRATYQIFTDMSCDLEAQELERLEVLCLPIGLSINGKEYPDRRGRMPNVSEFYEMQKACGGKTTTSGINAVAVVEAFTPVLAAGQDILFIGIAPEMSAASWNGLNIAKDELQEKYPERRIEMPNTHSIAPGLGMLVTKVVEQRNQGISLNEALKLVDYYARRMAHYFTVESLEQLKKSGRVSTLQAIVAGVANVRPLMCLPYSGKLQSIKKVRGAKVIIRELADRVENEINDPHDYVWIAFGGDNDYGRAEELMLAVLERCPNAKTRVHRIGPIIGAHTGETVLAVFFLASGRNDES
jgi:DegV family protein with EDD domain